MKKTLIAFATVLLTTAFAIAQQAAPPKPPSVEDRLKHLGDRLDKDLQLSADQKQKVLNVYKDFFTHMDELVAKNPPPPPPPANKEEMDKLVNDRDTKVKALLNDEQFNKLKSMQMHRGPGHMRKPGKEGNPPTPPAI